MPGNGTIGHAHQAAGCQSRQAACNSAARIVGRRAHRLGSFEVPSADKRSEPREQPLLIGRQEVEAPGERRAERLVVRRAGASSGWSGRPARVRVCSSSADGVKRSDRAAASSIASGSASSRSQIRAMTGSDAASSTRSGWTARARSMKSVMAASRASGSTSRTCSVGRSNRTRLVATILQRSAVLQQRADDGHPGQQVFEIVDHEQRVAAAKLRCKRLERGFVGQAERVGDRGQDEVRRPHRRKWDEVDAV